MNNRTIPPDPSPERRRFVRLLADMVEYMLQKEVAEGVESTTETKQGEKK